MQNAIKYADKYMIKIPGGEIELRDDRKKAKWKVEIKPFLLAQYPVTKELYITITERSDLTFRSNEQYRG